VKNYLIVKQMDVKDCKHIWLIVEDGKKMNKSLIGKYVVQIII